MDRSEMEFALMYSYGAVYFNNSDVSLGTLPLGGGYAFSPGGELPESFT